MKTCRTMGDIFSGACTNCVLGEKDLRKGINVCLFKQPVPSIAVNSGKITQPNGVDEHDWLDGCPDQVR